MDTQPDIDPAMLARLHARSRAREEGWTPDVMEMFIIHLIETGSVRRAARNVDRHVTTAYRLRAKEPAFAAAWDAARRMAYARLRDEAMERALEGTLQQVWKDGGLIGMKRVYNDRLLMNLLNHLRHEADPKAAKLRSVDDIEDKRSDAIAGHMDALALLPPPPPPRAPRPPRLRPANGRIVTTVNGVALV
ncbi:hypothetical protein [Sandarakinorhabdus sp. DWP1-3-1]|uniref:hypothetical protein n=1 Tax=Sandarakinorhabdus sp. DWP1-3-1 TaxID=2804627 RepID=UPI003CED2158